MVFHTSAANVHSVKNKVKKASTEPIIICSLMATKPHFDLTSQLTLKTFQVLELWTVCYSCSIDIFKMYLELTIGLGGC